MKQKLLASILILVALTSSASATITLNFQFGQARDSIGALIPDGTLWVAIASSDTSFAGGFGSDGSLNTTGDANSVFSIGQTISLGDIIGDDTVFAMGAFNGVATGFGAGYATAEETFTLGVNNVTAGGAYAFYWFPGSTFSGSGTEVVGAEVGGLNWTVEEAGLQPMVFPADASNIFTGADNGFGGTVPIANFTAVVLIPEPSSILLSALGVLGLFRRKR